MVVFVVTLSDFMMAMLAMAVGAIVARRPLKGSCGGIAVQDCDGSGGGGCEFCGGDNAR